MADTTIPLLGVPCAACGQPAHHAADTTSARQVAHLDLRLRPCTIPLPARTSEASRG